MRTLWQLAHGLDVRSKWMARDEVASTEALLARLVTELERKDG